MTRAHTRREMIKCFNSTKKAKISLQVFQTTPFIHDSEARGNFQDDGNPVERKKEHDNEYS